MPATKRTGDSPARQRPSAKRIRAARAFRGLERPAFADITGIDKERLNYLENGKGAPTDMEEDAIQNATGVPLAFLRHGFEPDDGSDAERLDRRVSQLGSKVDELTESATQARLERDALIRTVERLTQFASDRLGFDVEERLAPDQTPRDEDDRLAEGDPPTP